MSSCYNCNQVTDSADKFCPSCGTILVCKKCTSAIVKPGKFCKECGFATEMPHSELELNKVSFEEEVFSDHATRKFEASFSNAVGSDALSVIAHYMGADKKMIRTANKTNLNTASPIQIAGSIFDQNPINNIIEYKDDKIQLLQIDLKAKDKGTYFKSFTYLILYFYNNVLEVPISRDQLFVYLKEYDLYSPNYSTWLNKQLDFDANNVADLKIRAAFRPKIEELINLILDEKTTGRFIPGQSIPTKRVRKATEKDSVKVDLFRHDPEKYKIPPSDWTAYQKGIWFLHVCKEQGGPAKLTGREIFKAYQSMFSTSRISNQVGRDLKIRSKGPGSTVRIDDDRLSLLEAGVQEAKRLVKELNE